MVGLTHRLGSHRTESWHTTQSNGGLGSLRLPFTRPTYQKSAFEQSGCSAASEVAQLLAAPVSWSSTDPFPANRSDYQSAASHRRHSSPSNPIAHGERRRARPAVLHFFSLRVPSSGDGYFPDISALIVGYGRHRDIRSNCHIKDRPNRQPDSPRNEWRHGIADLCVSGAFLRSLGATRGELASKLEPIRE